METPRPIRAGAFSYLRPLFTAGLHPYVRHAGARARETTMKTQSMFAAALVALSAGAAVAQQADNGVSPARIFEIVDRNGDGAVSFEEASRANPNWTAEIFASFDADGNAALSADEFARLFAEGPPPPGL